MSVVTDDTVPGRGGGMVRGPVLSPDERAHRGVRQTGGVTPPPPLPLAPAIDAVCLALFVALGRESHGIGRSVGWFFTVLWPFAVGWFAVAVAVRLYTSGTRPWLRLTVAWIAGLALALVLRSVFTH